MPGVRKQHPGRQLPTPAAIPKLTLSNYKSHTDQCFSLVALDALGQVKRALRSLFGRRKKKKQPEPTPSSNAPTQTTAAAAAAPVEAPTTSNRSIGEAENATETEQSPHPPPDPAAAPTPSTAAAIAPDSPPIPTTAPASSDPATSQQSERQPHISAPSQIEEAKEIDLNPAKDNKTEPSDVMKDISDGDPASRDLRPKLKPEETGMSATSGPMGDHMAEVWRDSDVGVKEGRPVELEGDSGERAEGAGGKVEGEMF